MVMPAKQETSRARLRNWLFTGGKSSVTRTFLLLGGSVTLLRIFGEQLPTLADSPWKSLGHLLYCAFTVFIWVGAAVWLTSPGQRKPWEWLLFAPAMLWGSCCIPLMDRPAATLLTLPLVIRYCFGTRPALYSLLLLSVGATYEAHHFTLFTLREWWRKAYEASLSGSLATLILTLSQGIFSFGAYELALRSKEKQRQLELALHTLESYRDLELENTALQERSRLSRELHDSLGHQLTILRLESQKAVRLLQKAQTDAAALGQTLQTIVERSGEALTQLQDIVSTLRETELDGALFRAIEELVYRWPEPVHLSIVGEEPPLSCAAKLALYRAAQECLTNAYKYASGQQVTINVRVAGGLLLLRVRNGLSARQRQSGLAAATACQGYKDALKNLADT